MEVNAVAEDWHGAEAPPEPPPQGMARDEAPWSDEAEQAVLGAVLLDNQALQLVGDVIGLESFFRHEHRLLWGAITGLLAEQKTADPITVMDRLADSGQAEDAGGMRYMVSLMETVATPRGARRYAEIVAERHHERMLLAAVDEAASMARQRGVDLGQRIDHITAAVLKVEQARKSPGKRIPLLKLDALKKQAASVGWLVKHVIPAESIGMLFGGSGTFKSFIALDCALHVARGMPWMGRKTKEGPVLYIAAEGGTGLWNRIDAWHRQRNLRWSDAPVYVVPQAVDLTVDSWRIVDAAQACGVTPQLVVVDTLSQTYAGEENSANEMAAYLRELGLRFRALWGCAVLLIHHTGHQATERPRGSSAIRANLDFMLGVFRDEREMLATVSCVKQKDGDLFPEAHFSMTVQELGADEDNDPITSLVAKHLGTAEQLEEARQKEAEAGRGGRDQRLMALVSNGMTEKDLRKAFYEELDGLDADAKKKAYYRARDRALKAGQIEIAEGFVIKIAGGKKC